MIRHVGKPSASDPVYLSAQPEGFTGLLGAGWVLLCCSAARLCVSRTAESIHTQSTAMRGGGKRDTDNSERRRKCGHQEENVKKQKKQSKSVGNRKFLSFKVTIELGHDSHIFKQ